MTDYELIDQLLAKGEEDPLAVAAGERLHELLHELDIEKEKRNQRIISSVTRLGA